MSRRLLAFVALVVAAQVAGAQNPGQPLGEWHYIGGDVKHTRYSPLDQITAANFQTLEVAWTWRGDNFGPSADPLFRATPLYVDGLLYTVAGQRRTVAAIDPGTGETRLDLPRARHHALGARDAQQLRQGRGLCRGGRPQGDLLHLARLLPARHRRQVGPAPRELGHQGAAAGISGQRRHRHAARPGEGLAAVAPVRIQVRRQSRHPARPRQPVDIVAADRRQRRGRRRQRPRAGLLPDPHREHPRRHPRLRRAQRQAAVEVPRHPAAGRVRPRHLEERGVAAHRRRLVVGADVGRPRARPGLHPDQSADHRLLRRLPAGRQPVRHQPHRPRRQDGAAPLALPDGAPRHLELRQPAGAGAARRADRRADDADRGRDDQAGLRLRLQSRDRPADLADRRAPGRRLGSAR